MIVGALAILIGLLFCFLGIGGRGSVRSSVGGFFVSAGGGVILIIAGILILGIPG